LLLSNKATMSIFGTLPDVTKLSGRVLRVMGGNPGKLTLQGSNTYLVGTGEGRLLIDTGVGNPRWLNTLKKVLQDEKAQVTTALITHWHADHVGGIDDLHSLCPNARIYKNNPGHGQENITDGQEFTVEGATLTAHHTPGHTFDHMCFFFLEEAALFTGDNVLGHGTSVFENLATYMSSLRKMEKIPGLTGRGYPGHGEVLGDAKSAVNDYIAHRIARERHVLTVLKEGHPLGGDGAMTAMEIVELVYKEVSRDLWPAAESGVVQILCKLEEDGRVVREGDSWVLR